MIGFRSIKTLSSSFDITVSEFALIHAFTNHNNFVNLIGIRNFENLKSLEKILSMKSSDLIAIKKLAYNFKVSKIKV